MATTDESTVTQRSDQAVISRDMDPQDAAKVILQIFGENAGTVMAELNIARNRQNRAARRIPA